MIHEQDKPDTQKPSKDDGRASNTSRMTNQPLTTEQIEDLRRSALVIDEVEETLQFQKSGGADRAAIAITVGSGVAFLGIALAFGAHIAISVIAMTLGLLIAGVPLWQRNRITWSRIEVTEAELQEAKNDLTETLRKYGYSSMNDIPRNDPS